MEAELAPAHVADRSTAAEDLPRWLATSLLLLSAMVLLAIVLVAAIHINDRYGIDVASGARVALARDLNHGILYPELHEGDFFGGTRFMPLPILIHGGLAALTGEYLISGKVINYAAMTSLLCVVLVVLRRMRCPLPIALALTAAVLTTETGLGATMSLRGDTLPLLLQVLAVTTIVGSDRTHATFVASAFAALAFAAKMSAVWAPIAIGIWLFNRSRKRLALFAVGYMGLIVVTVSVLGAVTEGRFYENVFGLSTAGVGGLGSFLVAPYRLVLLTVQESLGTSFLFPLVAAMTWLAIKQRDASIYLLSLLCSVAIITLVLADIGTGWNQLIDLPVLTALVLGEFAGPKLQDPRASLPLNLVLGLFIAWVLVVGMAVTLLPAVKGAVATVRDPRLYSADPLAGTGTSSTAILSEDPYVPVSLGQNPVVLDPFMLPRIGRDDPRAISELIDRIDAREFDLIILVERLEPVDREWWRDYHFGSDVVRAMARNYRFREKLQGYYLYDPNEPVGA